MNDVQFETINKLRERLVALTSSGISDREKNEIMVNIEKEFVQLFDDSEEISHTSSEQLLKLHVKISEYQDCIISLQNTQLKFLKYLKSVVGTLENKDTNSLEKVMTIMKLNEEIIDETIC